MAYEKTNWVDNETPINAANLNKMEEGIVEASKTGGILDGSIIDWEDDEIPEGYEEVESGYYYSTQETFTGKYWKDGSKIYRKCIDFTGAPDSIPHGISNLKKVIKYHAPLDRTEQVVIGFNLPHADVDASYICDIGFISSTDVIFAWGSMIKTVVAGGTFVMEYIKIID